MSAKLRDNSGMAFAGSDSFSFIFLIDSFEVKKAMRNLQDVSRRLARCLETSCKRRLETSFCETSCVIFFARHLVKMNLNEEFMNFERKSIIFDPVSSRKEIVQSKIKQKH